jgi:23S rRNA U2552 (ribose-2'-O)-methylase RlmE/FtsJ
MEPKAIELWGSGGPNEAPLRLYTSNERKSPLYTPESKILQQCKNMIDTFYNEGKWDDYKKLTNPFEYIFLSWNRRTSRSVATRQPLSRSFFKMIELWQLSDFSELFLKLVERDGGFVSAHAAEGPGGFIEAATVQSKRQSWKYKNVTAITLRSTQRNVPGWRKTATFLEEHPFIEIHDGADGTGDILIHPNRNAFIERVLEKNPNGVHLFTADGGFDFSSDFNAQEDTILPLLYAEAYIGLKVLTKGGCFVLKCFDTTEQSTIDLIYVLSQCFCTWGFVKPCTSRAGNAERYFIGKGFLGTVQDNIDLIEKYIVRDDYRSPMIDEQSASYKKVSSDLYELQCRIEHAEIQVIQETLELIKHTDSTNIRKFVRDNVIRSLRWCEIYNESISTFWLTDLDRNVQKECTDLIALLNTTVNNSFYTNRISQSNSTISFAGFRQGTLESLPKSDIENTFIAFGHR